MGCVLGLIEGDMDGTCDGCNVGRLDGWIVGCELGTIVG